MRDWNVVVSVHDEQFGHALALLQPFGRVKRTDFHNVLVMRVRDTRDFADRFAAAMAATPDISAAVARAVPVSQSFDFHTPDEFHEKAEAIAMQWLPHLAGKSFHVRLHRRGLKGQLSSQPQEQALDRALMEALQAAGTPGRITFEDPDAIIGIETVGNRAGMSLWSREDLRHYPFLRID